MLLLNPLWLRKTPPKKAKDETLGTARTSEFTGLTHFLEALWSFTYPKETGDRGVDFTLTDSSGVTSRHYAVSAQREKGPRLFAA